MNGSKGDYMFINAVLQKYPNLKRPEALFDISNLTIGFGEIIKSNKKPCDNVCCKPSFKTSLVEFTSKR